MLPHHDQQASDDQNQTEHGQDHFLLKMLLLDGMDHLDAVRGNIARLRAEIAEIQQLDDHYWRYGRNAIEAEQIGHDKRLERLKAIQQELAQLAGLGGRVLSLEQRKDEHRSRLHLVKKAS